MYSESRQIWQVNVRKSYVSGLFLQAQTQNNKRKDRQLGNFLEL